MYTRCTHCQTMFKVTAEQLREGDIDCMTCGESFNVLADLADDIPALMARPPVISESTPEAPVEEIPPKETAPKEIAEQRPEKQQDTDGDGEDDSDREDESQTEDEHEDDAPVDDTPEKEAPEEECSEEEHHEEEHPEIEAEEAADELHPETQDEDEPESLAASLEFDAPEQAWTNIFITNHRAVTANGQFADADEEPAGLTDTGAFEGTVSDKGEWQELLEEVDRKEDTEEEGSEEDAADPFIGDDDDDLAGAPVIDADDPEAEYDPVEAESIDYLEDEFDYDEESVEPLWLHSEEDEFFVADEQPQTRDWPTTALLTIVTLAALLGGQLLHYNRDTLAMNPGYGSVIRQLYPIIGIEVYPDWPLNAYEVSGTEAVAGKAGQNTLNINANVIVAGKQRVGLPMIRIELRDRWAAPVASRVFHPDEYLTDEYLKVADIGLANPGTAIPVRVSVVDPGTAALGYIVDVCLPRRTSGLECQIKQDPFK
ncbi:MAG: DUF3426 domain-containing protein [Gammaproteobacteria bacterium]|nr:DUF3426 domain-containing protein [Gammaproteobacteria bacterium]